MPIDWPKYFYLVPVKYFCLASMYPGSAIFWVGKVVCMVPTQFCLGPFQVVLCSAILSSCMSTIADALSSTKVDLPAATLSNITWCHFNH